MPEGEEQFLKSVIPGELAHNAPPQVESGETRILQSIREEITRSRNFDAATLNELKKRLSSEHPDALEEIEVAVGMIQNIFLQKQIDKKRENGKLQYDPEVSKKFAEFNFLASHYFGTGSFDHTYAEAFWHTAKNAAELMHAGSSYATMKSGIIGQVGVYKTLKALGQNPQLSTPKDDVYYQIDMWSERDEKAQALQVKTSSQVEKGIILNRSDMLDFPAVVQTLGEKERYFMSQHQRSVSGFSASLDKYRQLTHKKIKAWYVVMPKNAIDPLTGDPSPEIIEEFRKRMDGIRDESE